MTAAATTGPNSEPRPTSSTPATMRAPSCHALFSNRSVQCSFFSNRSLAAEAESGFPDADVSFCGTKVTVKPSSRSRGLWCNVEKAGTDLPVRFYGHIGAGDLNGIVRAREFEAAGFVFRHQAPPAAIQS